MVYYANQMNKKRKKRGDSFILYKIEKVTFILIENHVFNQVNRKWIQRDTEQSE